MRSVFDLQCKYQMTQRGRVLPNKSCTYNPAYEHCVLCVHFNTKSRTQLLRAANVAAMSCRSPSHMVQDERCHVFLSS